MGEEYLALRRTMRQLDLVTVCEEAGCPNIFECWADGDGHLHDQRGSLHPGLRLLPGGHPPSTGPRPRTKPERVASAVQRLGLAHAVVTAVARDDLADGGAGAFVATIAAIRASVRTTAVEVLVPDCKGDQGGPWTCVFASRPDVLNHNLETVARLQRAVRPSAGYARSLAVLARAKAAGLDGRSPD